MDHITAYNISDDDRMLIASMANLTPAPAIILQTPLFGEVGESDLICDLRNLVYAKNVRAGLHRMDSLARHLAYRNLPYEGSPADYQSFADCLQETNPFADKFYGIDAIDMTGWAGKSFSGIGWNKLKHHIRDNAETDFVFVMKSGDGPATDLLSALQRDCGIPVEKISLSTPEPDMLAGFVEKRIELPDEHKTHLVKWIERFASERSVSLNYSWANRLAAKVAMERAFLDDPAAFLMFLEESGPALLGKNNKKLGF